MSFRQRTDCLEQLPVVYKQNLDLNHAWGAAPANLIIRKLMGDEPLTPGFETFQIKPKLGNLTHASLRAPTIKGDLSVTSTKNAGQEPLDVVVPGGTTATIHMPNPSGKANLFLDGKPIRKEAEHDFLLVRNVRSGKHIMVLT